MWHEAWAFVITKGAEHADPGGIQGERVGAVVGPTLPPWLEDVLDKRGVVVFTDSPMGLAAAQHALLKRGLALFPAPPAR